MTTYLLRPTQFQAIQWDGTNASAVNALLQPFGWSFSASNGGEAHSPFGSTFPLAVTEWAVTNGAFLAVSASDFESQYVAGSSWAIVP